MNNDIEIYRGDNDTFYAYLADYSSGTPVLVNVATYTLICSVKARYEDPDSMVVMPQKVYVLSSNAGTGTISSSGSTVTGSGTSFTSQLQVGDLIVSRSQVRNVSAIASNTSLTTQGAVDPSNVTTTINDAFSPTLSGASFSYIRPQVVLSKTDTDIQFGNYVYDVKYIDSNGNVITVIVGNFKVNKNVSRKTS